MKDQISFVIYAWIEINKYCDSKVYKQGQILIVRDSKTIQDAVIEFEAFQRLLHEHGWEIKVIEETKETSKV